MKKFIFLIFVLILFLVTSCSSQNGVDQSAASGTGNNDSSSTVLVQTEGAPVKQFDIIAKQWSFDPSEIRVNLGDKVVLNVESIDVAHGFALNEFGVDEVLNPGDKVSVEFIANKTGTFSFFCTAYCGEGHTEMAGTLIVE